MSSGVYCCCSLNHTNTAELDTINICDRCSRNFSRALRSVCCMYPISHGKDPFLFWYYSNVQGNQRRLGPGLVERFSIDETFPKNRRLVHLLESTYLEAYIGIR